MALGDQAYLLLHLRSCAPYPLTRCPCLPLLLPYAGYASLKRRPRVRSSRGHIFYQQLPGGAQHDGDQRVLSADGLHSIATRHGALAEVPNMEST